MMDSLIPLEEAQRNREAEKAHLAPGPADDAAGSVVRLVEKTTERPTIRIVAGELSEIATAAERVLIESGLPIYERGRFLVRPVVQEVDASHGRRTRVAQFATVESVYLRDLLARVARWEKFNIRKKEWVAADPPGDVAPTILSRYGEWSFPVVVGVITTPTLRPDGAIFSDEGYDPATRLILVAPPELPPIPGEPSRDDALAALAFLESLLEEFPLIDGPSLSVALSVMITPVVRGAFPVAPMHIARAPVAASGKSYLFDVAAAIAIGQPCPVMAAGRTEEETEKRLGAALLAGQPLISIDNLNGELRGDALCQAIERPVVEIRILGKSERIRIEARGTTFLATGNNLLLAGDMTRRAIVATLDPQLERPELREFTADPVEAVLQDRGRYIAAALTIARAYIVAGRPEPAPRLASFEGWSDTVRSALIWLGRADPVETMVAAREEDPERAALAALLAGWCDAFGVGWENRRTVVDALKAVDERDTRLAGDGGYSDGYDRPYRHPELREAVKTIAATRGQLNARRFGDFLRKSKGRIVNLVRFANQSDPHGHAASWWVEEI